MRLKKYNYSLPGYYLVTICTHKKRNILCKIVRNDAIVVPSDIGKIIIVCWNNISKVNDNVYTDLFCLMPNHIHGIIVIENKPLDININLQKKYGFETTDQFGQRSLPGIIKDFKSVTTRLYNKIVDRSLKNKLWQKSYYDRVIRNDRELQEIREYIQNNPLKWQEDKYFV